MKTIHLTLITFCLILFCYDISAQPEMKIGYGIKAGGNFTGRMFEKGAKTDENRKLIPNFHVGVLADIPLSVNWKMQPEIQFLRAGHKSTMIDNDFRYDTTQRVSYLNVPIAFNCYFRNVNVKPYFSIGPYVGYALGGSVSSESVVNGAKTKNSRSIDFGKDGKDHLRRFDAGFMLGAGMDLDFFTLEFKYSQSLLSQYIGETSSIYSVNMNLALSLVVFF